MAVATTMRRGAFNQCYRSTMNIYVNSSAGIVPGGLLTLAGDVVVTVIHELPHLGWKTEVTGLPPRGSTRLRIKKNDSVTG
jgi:hypothetical protein